MNDLRVTELPAVASASEIGPDHLVEVVNPDSSIDASQRNKKATVPQLLTSAVQIEIAAGGQSARTTQAPSASWSDLADIAIPSRLREYLQLSLIHIPSPRD